MRPTVWCGDSPTKGLAVLSFTGARLEVDPIYDSSLKHLLPVVVIGASNFRLLTVWTKEDAEQRAVYIGQAVLGVQRYASLIADDATVVTGDFSSNQIWDRPGWPYMHAEMVQLLDGLGLVSTYHHRGEAQGTETCSTFYMYRKQERGLTSTTAFCPKRGRRISSQSRWAPMRIGTTRAITVRWWWISTSSVEEHRRLDGADMKLCPTYDGQHDHVHVEETRPPQHKPKFAHA